MEIRIIPVGELATTGARLVAEWLADAVSAGRAVPTLMPALGASGLELYAALGRLRAAADGPVPPLRLIQLDEYVGVAADDPRSLFGWLRRDVAAHLGVRDDEVIRLAGDAADPRAACAGYDASVATAGGVDVAVLGLGPNGHLGFNEPPSAADAPTRVVRLSAESLASSAAYWPGLEVPTHALTAGMATILAARRIVLVVPGGRKHAILRRLLDDPVDPDLPASWLRDHPGTTLLADDAAWRGDGAMPARPS